MTEHDPSSSHEHRPDGPQTGPEVTILVDNKEYSIHRGRQSVEAIKILAGVPLAYELEQVIDGGPQPLPDDGSVTIKGDERFISHPRTASSS